MCPKYWKWRVVVFCFYPDSVILRKWEERGEREGGCFDPSNDHHLDAVLSCRGFSFYQMGSNLIERDPSAAVPSDVMWDKADERLAHLPPPYQSLLFTFIWSSLHIEDVRQGNPVIGKHSLWSEFSIKRFEKIISTSSHPSLPDTLMIARLSPSIIDTATTEITFPSEELNWECWEVLIPIGICVFTTWKDQIN